MKKMLFAVAAVVLTLYAQGARACTGITLKAPGGTPVPARTIEWAGSDLESRYCIVPHGYAQRSFLPNGKKEGLQFTARYGYVGLAVYREEFVVDGLNEAGLSAGLFYFPKYGEYEAYSAADSATTLSDMQLVPWILSCFKTINEVKEAIKGVHVVATDPRASTAHWRITEEGGRQVVLEIVGKELRFYENKLGVLTNSPGFEWHLTNLNNYVNLFPGHVANRTMGALTLSPFGSGGGLLGIPGDITPPSRFVRAAFYQATAPLQPTAGKTVEQAFHILSNFDIPIGIEFGDGEQATDIPSATQWTVVTDIANRRIYYRTMYDSAIRCIDLKAIDFRKVKFTSSPLDAEKRQPVEMVKVK